MNGIQPNGGSSLKLFSFYYLKCVPQYNIMHLESIIVITGHKAKS